MTPSQSGPTKRSFVSGRFPGMSLNTDLTVNITVSLVPLLIIITMLMKLYNQIQGENTLVQSQMRVSRNHLSLYHVSFTGL